MRLGIHLPQYGRASGPDSIREAARAAEQLGYDDVWVSDHIVSPAAQDYPSPYLFDPVLTLTYAAAVTERVGLGTSVLVVAQYHPLWLANAVASLDQLCGGRFTLGVGVGWSAPEFAALGQSFGDRGRRTDEILEILRLCWSQSPASHHGAHYRFDDIRVLPQPAHRIPMWIGGRSEAAYRRALAHGDGFQLIGVTPEDAAEAVQRLRGEHPDPAFTISLRTGWDPQGMDPGLIRDELAAFTDAGVQHVVAAPWRSDLASWLQSMELLAEIVISGRW